MYQFIHADIYARTASTNAKSASKYNYKDILGEATRLPEHSQHVKNPKPPKFLLGDEDALAKMSERIEYNAANYKDKIGRKMRADAPVLLAGVVSFPQEVVEADPILYQKWASLNLEYLQNKYGDNLRAVVEHTDEEYPHLHFYVQSDTEVNAKMIHDGYKAGKDYKRACQKWQDEYYEAVAVKCGMARLGPKRRRLNRAEWHAEKERNMTLVNAERAVNEVLNNAMVREKDAALKSRENDDIARALINEKRKAKEAMQKALELQAEAREKIAQSEAILSQYGLSDVPLQPKPAPEVNGINKIEGTFDL